MRVWAFIIISIFYCGSRLYSQTFQQQLERINDRVTSLIEEEEPLDSLDIYLDEARSLFLKEKDYPTYAHTFIDHGRLLISARMAEKALHRLERVLLDLKENGVSDLPLLSQIRYEYARAFYYNGAFDDCITALEANLNFMAQNELEDDKDTQLNLLGNALRRVNKPLEAIQKYEQALDLRIALFGAKANPVSSVYNNLGNAYSDIGLYNKAVENYQASLDIKVPLVGDNHPSVIGVKMNAALLYFSKGELQKARKFMNQIKKFFLDKDMKGTEELADLYLNLGAILRQIGALDEALDHYREAQSIYDGMKGELYLQEQAIVLNNIANVYSSKGDHQNAVNHQLKAIEKAIIGFGVDDPEVARYYTNLGLEYQILNEFQKSIIEHQKSIAILENKDGFKVDLANTRNNLADAYLASDQLERALTTNQLALKDQLNILGEKDPALAYTYNKLAITYKKLGNKTEALQSLQKAFIANHMVFSSMDIQKNPDLEGAIMDSYFFETHLLKAQWVPDQAPFLFQQAIALLDKQRQQLVSRDDQIILARHAKELSSLAVNYWLNQYENDRKEEYLVNAYYSMERSKANVLLNNIAQNQAIQFSGVPDSLIEQEQKLQSDIQYYRQKLGLQPDSLRTRLYQKELFEARQAYNELVTSLGEQYPKYYHLKHKNNIIPMDAIQQKLASNTALISYFMTDTTAFAMKITQTEVELKKLDMNEDLIQDLIGMKKSIYYQLDEDYLKLAHLYFKKLLPFQFSSSVDQLVISPDGLLSNFPFGALLQREHPESIPDFRELSYLIRDYSISYTPSVSLFGLENDSVIPSDAGFVAFAPVFSDVVFPEVDLEKGAEILAQRMKSIQGSYISTLPGTELEVNSISKIFEQAGLSNITYMNNSATEAQLKDSSISKVAYLHIASHGFVNEDQPSLSGIQLYPVEGEEDNILYSGEVYNLNLNARLLVLSACETGLGREATGEGLLGFSRAFRYAGAQNLIVSQWKIQDDATANLMVSFYENHLLNSDEQHNFADSLRKAKMKLIQSEAFSHPYYWSGMVLIGN